MSSFYAPTSEPRRALEQRVRRYQQERAAGHDAPDVGEVQFA
jgi:hypothetical protein